MPEKAQQVTKLGLRLPTDPRWVNLTEKNLEDILTDHAYCEQKAATACISLIQAFPDKKELVDALAPIVTEEWGHFRMVLRELDKRELDLGRQRKDEYVNAIMQLQKKDGARDDRLVERLLICALIEARSCERFRLLSLELEEEEMRDFYHHFMVSEAGHYKMFIKLAKLYGGEEKVEERWREILTAEAEIMATMTPRGDRMH
jgi:tRNA-(ms[2]io[6]A)-hydroxylase